MGERHFAEIDHESCVAFYSGELPVSRASRVRVYLEAHPDTARRAQADAAHERALGQSHADVLQEPIPRRLQVRGAPATVLWPRRVGVAAVIVVSASAGWWLGNSSGPVDAGAAFAARVASVSQQPPGAAGTTVGTPGTVEVPAPDLSMRGYRLVQERLLGDGERALAEFVYRSRNGRQVRVYAEEQLPRGTPTPTVTSQEGVALAQWRQGDTHYALVGDLPDMSLQALAQSAAAPDVLAGGGPWNDSSLGGLEGGITAQQSAPVTDQVMPAAGDGRAAYPGRM